MNTDYINPDQDDVLEQDQDNQEVSGSTRLLHLRDGRLVLLRPAQTDDAHQMLLALNEVANEGRFLLRRAWEITPELEQRWISVALGEMDLVVVCMLLEGEQSRAEMDMAGSLSLVRGRPEFVRHTAELGMWLRSAYREQGLGSAMVEYALNWARAEGDIEKIALSARSANRRALNLYRKYGFHEEGRRRGQIKTEQGYEDEVLLGSFVGSKPPPGADHPAMPDDEQEGDDLP